MGGVGWGALVGGGVEVLFPFAGCVLRLRFVCNVLHDLDCVLHGEGACCMRELLRVRACMPGDPGVHGKGSA